MNFPRPIVVSLALAALIATGGAAAVWNYATRVKGEISLEVRYSIPTCSGEILGALTSPTWDQMTAAQRAFSYDKSIPEKIFMAGVLWRRTGDDLAQKGINLGEPTTWRDRHVSIQAGKAFKGATGEVMCRYELRFSDVSPELAAKVLFAAEHTYREHVFKRGSDTTNEQINWLETQITKLEAAVAAVKPTDPEFEKASASLVESRRQLTEARENLRLLAVRRTITTAKLL